jgi:hypothetical protein
MTMSEDEKIRETIFELVEAQPTKEFIGDVSKDDCLAWLEKQKDCVHIKKDWFEHLKQSWYKEGFIDGKYIGGTSKEWTINDATTLKELIDFLENGTVKLQHDLTQYANWLKIQFAPNEKQGEQELADKAEPRFHEGDWVVFNEHHDSIYQIEKIENYEYTLRHILGGSMPLSFSHESSIRLWDVYQDAKDGDVLAFYGEYRGNKMVQVGKIEKYVGKHGGCSNTFKIYVGVNWDNNLQIGEYMGCSDIRPATKEQRDTLERVVHSSSSK